MNYLAVSFIIFILFSLYVILIIFLRGPFGGGPKWVKKCLSVPDDPMLIRPPRGTFFIYIFFNWFMMFLLWLLSYNVLALISIPLWVFTLYSWYYFCKTWQAYGYLKVILNTATIIVNIALFILAELIRRYIAPYIF
jgi:hypothetical protein